MVINLEPIIFHGTKFCTEKNEKMGNVTLKHDVQAGLILNHPCQHEVKTREKEN